MCVNGPKPRGWCFCEEQTPTEATAVVPRLPKSPRPNVPPRLLESHAQVCTLSLTPAAETEAVRPASAGESHTEKEDNNRL